MEKKENGKVNGGHLKETGNLLVRCSQDSETLFKLRLLLLLVLLQYETVQQLEHI